MIGLLRRKRPAPAPEPKPEREPDSGADLKSLPKEKRKALRDVEATIKRLRAGAPPEIINKLKYPKPLSLTRLPEYEQLFSYAAALAGSAEQGAVEDTLRSSLLLRQYAVTSGVIVSIYRDPSQRVAYYVVQEEEPDILARKLYELVMLYMYVTVKEVRRLGVPPEELRLMMRDSVVSILNELGFGDLAESYADIISYYVIRQSTLGEIYPLLLDPEIEEIELGLGGTRIVVMHRIVREYGALLTNIYLASPDEGRSLAQKIAAFCLAELSVANPRLSITIPEFGYRFTAVYGTGTEPPSFNIRKYPREPFTVPLLIKYGSISPLGAAYIWLLNEAKRVWMPAGASGTGKNTMLNALMMLVDPLRTKVVAVMDTDEFTLRPTRECDPRLYPRFVKMLASNEDEMLEKALLALRYVPDYLVLNEVRGKEIKALERAVASGDGVATTIHAGDPREVLSVIRYFTSPDEFERLKISLSAVIMMAKVGRRLDRRVVSIDELNVDPVTGREEWTTVIYYAGEKDGRAVFKPDTADEVFERSKTLREKIPTILRVSPSFVREELELRANFLQQLAEEGIHRFEEVALRILDFYGEYHERITTA